MSSFCPSFGTEGDTQIHTHTHRNGPLAHPQTSAGPTVRFVLKVSRASDDTRAGETCEFVSESTDVSLLDDCLLSAQELRKQSDPTASAADQGCSSSSISNFTRQHGTVPPISRMSLSSTPAGSILAAACLILRRNIYKQP